MYTNIPKPTGASYTKLTKPATQFPITRGYATGVIGPPTYSKAYPGTFYTNLPKPTNSTYTKINKPT